MISFESTDEGIVYSSPVNCAPISENVLRENGTMKGGNPAGRSRGAGVEFAPVARVRQREEKKEMGAARTELDPLTHARLQNG